MFVFKILNGPLCGAEVVIPAGACFVRLIEQGASHSGMSVNGDHAEAQDTVLTIPMAEPSANFTLTIGKVDRLGTSLSAEIFDAVAGTSEQKIEWNAPASIGALRFAVKHCDVPWSPEVIGDRGVPTVGVRRMSNAFRRRFTYAAAAMVSLVIAVLAINVWQTAGASSTMPERRMYTQKEDASKIEALLRRMEVPYFSVDVSKKKYPEVMLRVDAPVSGRSVDTGPARKAILRALPQAKSVRFTATSSQAAFALARQRMLDIGLNASLSLRPTHLTISVADHLSDQQLVELGEAIHELRVRWGESFIHLIVSQRDLVPLRALKTGRNGYELRGTSQIYFP